MVLLFYINLALNINLLLVGIILLFLKKGNKKANHLLGIVLLFLAYVNVIISFYVLKWPFKTFPYLTGTHVPFEFSVSPLMFFYFKSLFERNFIFKKKYWLHFIPAFYFSTAHISYFFLSDATKIKYINSPSVYKTHYYFATILYIQFAVYIFLMLRMLINYSRQIKIHDEYSSAISKWIKELIIFIILILLGNIIPVFLMPKNLLITTISISSIYFIILYKIFFQPDVFINLKTVHQIIDDIKKYPDSEITKDEEDLLQEKLMRHIEFERSHLDNDITLPELAKRIQVPYHQLSRFINERFKQNFNDFINSKRIEEAKKKILDDNYNYLTIDAIAQSVGFNSKSSFYNAFKKIENCSPTEFKRQRKLI